MANKSSFWYLAHCESGVPSSKRLWGGIGFGICQCCIVAATILCFVHTGELSGTVSSLIDFDLGISAALLGLSTITRAFGGNKSVIGGEKKEDETEENAED
jgi:hypothetical protein